MMRKIRDKRTNARRKLRWKGESLKTWLWFGKEGGFRRPSEVRCSYWQAGEIRVQGSHFGIYLDTWYLIDTFPEFGIYLVSILSKKYLFLSKKNV